jgi:SSS family solute:Na+ symporter
MYWRRFSATAAFWTLLGGSILVALSIMFPVLVTPFSHGVDPVGGFKYTRALYGLVGSGVIALLVTLFTRGRRAPELEGLVVGTLWQAKERYKGGKPNEDDGLKVGCLLRENDAAGEVSVNREVAESLKARVGDIVYLSDARWWLGGLRSVHAKVSDIRDDDDSTVLVARSLVLEGRLQVGRRHKIEKII